MYSFEKKRGSHVGQGWARAAIDYFFMTLTYPEVNLLSFPVKCFLAIEIDEDCSVMKHSLDYRL